MTHFKLIEELERDIRNQAMIDQMKKLGPAARLQVLLRRFNYPLTVGALASAIFWIILCMTVIHA